MQNTSSNWFVALSVFTLMSLSSCDSGVELNPSMNATVKGAGWNASNEVVQMMDNVITLTGIAEDGKTISFTIFGTSKGEYKVVNNTWEIEFGAYYKNTEFDELNDAWIAYEGVVNLETIDEESRSLSGNFRFNAKRGTDTLKVENGSFRDLKYIRP